LRRFEKLSANSLLKKELDMKPGRNAKCPCGSGKKYKKCCLINDETESFTRKLLMRTSDEVIPMLMDYITENYDRDTIRDAWEEFYKEDSDGDFHKTPYANMFVRWLFFLWTPDEPDLHDGIYPSPRTIAARFLRENRKETNSLHARYIEAACRDPLSFWQIESIEPGKGLLVKDLLLGREKFILDESCSETAKRWDIIFGSTMELDGISVFNIGPPYTVPAMHKKYIMEEFAGDFEDVPESERLKYLFDLDIDMIWFYQDLMDFLFNPSMSRLTNTDGSDLIYTNSEYEFHGADRDVILQKLRAVEAFELDPDGTRHRTKFTWSGKSEQSVATDQIVKGSIEVRRKIIETEANSAERDMELRTELKTILDGLISHRKTSSKPWDKIKPKGGLEDSGAINPEDLSEEDRETLQAHLEEMHLKWADTEVPALDGLTPRDAVKTPEGKARVIELINEWENMESRASADSPQFTFDINKLRKTLGLPEE